MWNRLTRVWTVLVGELPKEPQAPASTKLIWWIGLCAAMAFLFGEYHLLHRTPLLKAFWRLGCHGVLPLCAIAIWTHRSQPVRRNIATLALALAGLPIMARIVIPEATIQLIQQPALLAVPIVTSGIMATYVLRRSSIQLSDWGMGLGDWKWWAPRTAVIMLIIPVCLWLAMNASPELAAHYPTWKPARTHFPTLLAQQGLYGLEVLGWEFLFRGFLLFSVYRMAGPHLAIWLQCLPFLLLHFDKPTIELYLSWLGGLAAGWFCLRARSFWPLFWMHWVQLASAGFIGYILRNQS